MNQSIRHAWMVLVAMFVVLLAAASYVQVIGAQELNNNEANTRQLYQQFGSNRGPILVDGEPIAESVPADSDNFDYQRVYHEPEKYSGLTGFYSLTYGATGLENKLNAELSGTADGMIADRLNNLLTGGEQRGAQVELTIDPQMQEIAYSVLPDGIKSSVVISDPATGDVLAMASKPSYDTNLLATHSGAEARQNMEEITSQEGLSPYRTAATQEAVAPGSTFKLIQASAMLESGDYDPDTTLDLPNSITLPQTDGLQLRNFEGGLCSSPNQADFRYIFAQSCNTPFATAAMEMGQEPIVEMAEAFGFNDTFDMPLTATNSSFPTEQLPDATLAQSILGAVDVRATALQMNMVAAGIANDGTLMKPQLIDTVRGPDLNLLEDPEPEVYSEPISAETANELTGMMQEAVQSGTAISSRSNQVDIAAKTGTGQISDSTGADTTVHSWITGFAPADDPQVAVTLVYEDVPYDTGHQLTVDNMKKIMEAVVEQ
ncbi:penicillin-binding transpeptidase domain-containing protein [Auritidibacter ignavus]|uniref:penicillin-binding transpeptidase domain-containing protein n=1 Tax=Auritidibacter TaxID=1160973 RepID=UPI000D738DEB|nr:MULTISPECIES: penicillin-binding transpeptidase domain-containing protein [Auritidibacter]PXA77305.1 peptidoglycan glycosyltransferase [Auritidibacter sp. NML120779]AXR74427.1 penicillin-binding protein 2 [Auritidibacter sp. NML130574]PXA79334.1 peptidoglycan glycosyltransferase [Auritidibacter sp. NML120636]WGH80938.1 penicillin-binding transpeptidase domain-containing protein [Auritidibacter ignavus]WGH90136.1 penicillin-binding transpeptidase domain-containing protein [Auritidibacter ign